MKPVVRCEQDSSWPIFGKSWFCYNFNVELLIYYRSGLLCKFIIFMVLGDILHVYNAIYLLKFTLLSLVKVGM